MGAVGMKSPALPHNASANSRHWHPRGKQVVDLLTGQVYGSIEAAARVHGVGSDTMRRWTRDPRKPFIAVELRKRKA